MIPRIFNIQSKPSAFIFERIGLIFPPFMTIVTSSIVAPAFGVVYTNTTGKCALVACSINLAAPALATVTLKINGSLIGVVWQSASLHDGSTIYWLLNPGDTFEFDNVSATVNMTGVYLQAFN